MTAILTSASLHDSQAAIPLMRVTGERITYIYDVGRHVRVRGAPKVYTHLMFGMLVIAAEQILRLLN